jgi:hypothetical protein
MEDSLEWRGQDSNVISTVEIGEGRVVFEDRLMKRGAL